MNVEQAWVNWQKDEDSCAEIFTGTFIVSNEQGVIFEKCQGFRNRSESLLNNIDTAFGLASITKWFTGLAICKLIDAGRLSMEDKVHDILPHNLGQIDRRVTIFHLLTHSSGVGDYCDDEDDDVIEKLQAIYDRHPVHLWTSMESYMQLFTHLPPKFEPGERYGYSNTGYVLLGLVIEAVSGQPYQDFVTNEIIKPNGLIHTGFYRMNQLPANVAVGYTEDKKTGEYRSNIYETPIIGGSCSGLFSCANDLDKLWRSLVSNKILSPEITNKFLTPQITRDEEDNTRYYGFGLYLYKDDKNGRTFYYALGCDAGVNVFTAHFPKFGITASALGNFEDAEVIPLMYELVDLLYKEVYYA